MPRWAWLVTVSWATKGPRDRWFQRHTGPRDAVEICVPDLVIYGVLTSVWAIAHLLGGTP